VTERYRQAKTLLTDNLTTLNRLATELLEKEVLNAAEIDEIIGISAPVPEPEIAAG